MNTDERKYNEIDTSNLKPYELRYEEIIRRNRHEINKRRSPESKSIAHLFRGPSPKDKLTKKLNDGSLFEGTELDKEDKVHQNMFFGKEGAPIQ